MPSQSGSDDDGSLVHVPAVGINDLPPEPSLGRPQFVNGKLLVRGQNLAIPPLPTRSPLRPPPTPSRVPSDSALRDAIAKPLPGSPAAGPATPPTSFSKRKHALLELLSSERAFASDLALIRDIHIPIALGQSAGFTLPGIATPPASSSSSTRTVSTGSDTPATPATAQGPPMTREDVKTIFGNIEDIAQFADFFSEKLETALGELIEGGSGQDAVGALFLEVIPVMTPHYTTYITRHPGALAHFQALSANPSPAFSAYLTQTRALVASHTHAWDIPSLLIKPVQRLLKYPLLLSTIIDDTSDLHPDKENLQIARQNMEEAARGVNEGRRRWEVVKGVLDGKAPSLNAVGRMRSFRLGGGGKVKGAEDDDSIDIAAVEEMEKRLREFEKVMKAFGKETLVWIRSVKTTITSLREWSQRFGLVLGVGVDSSSDALNAFNEVLDDRLLSLCNDLESTLHAALIPQLKKLAATIGPPMLLISTMHNLRPSHIAFLNMPLAKSKNAAALMQASMSYQAIHAQLRHELPVYLRLLDKGFGAAVLQFAAWQQKFWEETYARWSELWVALEINSTDSSGEETVRVWWSRFEEAEVELMQLGILSRRIYKNHAHSKSSSSSVVLVSPVSQTHSINSPRRPSFTSSHASLAPIPHSRSQSLTNSEPVTQSSSRARSKERPATTESRSKQVRHREDFQDWSMERTRPPAEYVPQEYHTHYPHPPPMPRMKSEPAHLRTIEPKKRNPQLRDSGYQESRNSIVSTRTSNSANRDSMNLATNVALQLGALSPSSSRFASNATSGGTSRARKNVKERTRLTDDSSQRGLSRSADVLQQEVVLVPNQPNQRRKNSQPQRFEDDIIHYSSTTSKTTRGSDNHQRVLRGSDETVGGGSVRSPTKRSQTAGPRHIRAESERRRRTQDDPPPYRSRALTADTYYRPTAEPAELVRRRAEPTELNTISRTKRGDSLPAIGSNNRYSAQSGLPVLFHCVVVQSFEAPPSHIKYQSFPFLTLRIDDVVQIVYDGGHPADHDQLPIEVDETEAETLFLIKDDQQQIGWGLASYMVPIA